MNYYGSKDLAESFRTVRKNTIAIAEDIPEDRYSFRAAPETRTVAQLLYHIAAVPAVQEQVHAIERRTTLEGFDFPAWVRRLSAEEQQPRTKAQIIALLHENGERWAKWLEQQSDEFLAERVTYPAAMKLPSKSRFEMFLGVKEHEMHHRGQLMQMERMLGIVPHLTRQMQERMAAATGGRSAASS
ncbi:MAG TPA: DinB family protein [Bryobacteraceae bacterium]|nr:DinB family protein [Bryobacteraceae bacterium]